MYATVAILSSATFAQHWCVHAPTMPMPSGYDDEDEEDVDDDDDEDDDEDDDDDDDEEEEEEADNEADAEGQAPGSAGPLPAIEDCGLALRLRLSIAPSTMRACARSSRTLSRSIMRCSADLGARQVQWFALRVYVCLVRDIRFGC